MKDKIINTLQFIGTSIGKLCIIFVFGLILSSLNVTSLCGCRDSLDVERGEYNRLLIDAYKGESGAVSSFTQHYSAWSHSAVALQFYRGFNHTDNPYLAYEIGSDIKCSTRTHKKYIGRARVEKNLKTALFLMKTYPKRLNDNYKSTNDEQLLKLWREELDKKDEDWRY